jgi:hypothetical protein
MPLCYKIMSDLPKIPDEFLDYALRQLKQEMEKQVANINNGNLTRTDNDRIITETDGTQVVALKQIRINLEKELGKWVTDNITSEWQHIIVGCTAPSANISTPNDHCQPPHIDVSRQYTLQYLLEKSNPDQDTVFYREHGKPLRRKVGTRVLDMNKLEVIDSICAPLHTWILLDPSIIHHPRNIRGSRILLQIGLDCEPFGVLRD